MLASPFSFIVMGDPWQPKVSITPYRVATGCPRPSLVSRTMSYGVLLATPGRVQRLQRGLSQPEYHFDTLNLQASVGNNI
jgi:hypothetical protein